MQDITPESWIAHGTRQAPTPFVNDRMEHMDILISVTEEVIGEHRGEFNACYRQADGDERPETLSYSSREERETIVRRLRREMDNHAQ